MLNMLFCIFYFLWLQSWLWEHREFWFDLKDFLTFFFLNVNFCDFLFSYPSTEPLWKRVLLWKKEKKQQKNKGSSIFSFWCRPLTTRRVGTELFPLLVFSFPLTTVKYKYSPLIRICIVAYKDCPIRHCRVSIFLKFWTHTLTPCIFKTGLWYICWSLENI